MHLFEFAPRRDLRICGPQTKRTAPYGEPRAEVSPGADHLERGARAAVRGLRSYEGVDVAVLRSDGRGGDGLGLSARYDCNETIRAKSEAEGVLGVGPAFPTCEASGKYDSYSVKVAPGGGNASDTVAPASDEADCAAESSASGRTAQIA